MGCQTPSCVSVKIINMAIETAYCLGFYFGTICAVSGLKGRISVTGRPGDKKGCRLNPSPRTNPQCGGHKDRRRSMMQCSLPPTLARAGRLDDARQLIQNPISCWVSGKPFDRFTCFQDTVATMSPWRCVERRQFLKLSMIN